MQKETKEKLDRLSARYEELQIEMSNPEVLSNQERYLETVSYTHLTLPTSDLV